MLCNVLSLRLNSSQHSAARRSEVKGFADAPTAWSLLCEGLKPNAHSCDQGRTLLIERTAHRVQEAYGVGDNHINGAQVATAWVHVGNG